MNNPKVSIITIVFNGASTLTKTIESIASQTYSNIEYIIIDGKSTDETVNIIHRNEKHISNWISEPDNGLYDAMNKGIKLASGDYLWFINSGDEIYAPDTLENIFKDDQGPFADIYYGDTVMINSDGDVIGGRRLQPPKALNWKDFKKGMLVSHQSIIISTKIADYYNLNYRFSADFEWCLSALIKSKKTVNTQQVLSRFLDGGLTKQNIVPGLKERFRIMSRYFGLIPTLWRHIPIGIRFLLYVAKNRRF